LNEEKGGLKCSICDKFHEIAVWPKNNELSKLAKLNPNEVSRSFEAHCCKSLLKQIDDRAKFLEQDLEIGKHKITEYCDFIRNDVNLAAESWHQYIENYHEEFTSKINKYEDECLKHYDEFLKNRQSFDDIINESVDFHQKWSNYFENFNINDTELAVTSEKAKIMIKTLNKKEKNLKSETFNGKLIQFEPNVQKHDSRIMGKICFQNIKINFDQLEEIRTLPIKTLLRGYSSRHKIQVVALQDGTFLIGYLTNGDGGNNLDIITVDRSGKFLEIRYKILNKHGNNYSDDFKISTSNKYIFVYCYYTMAGTKANIKVFDASLSILSEIDFGFRISCCTAFENQFFSISYAGNEPSGTLSIFDSTLKNIQNLSQKDKDMPFHFPSDISKLEVNESFYFILCQNEIGVMSRKDGNVLSKFRIESTSFFLYLNETILSFESKSKTLQARDFDGQLELERSFEKFSPNFNLITIFKSELIFFDSIEESLNF